MKFNILILIAVVCSLLALVGFAKLPKTPFNYFPFDDTQAKYTISKLEDKGLSYYSLVYNDGQPDSKALLIGLTPVDLDQFINKEIRVSGSFIEGKPYCKGNCPKTNVDDRPVVKIDSISLAN